MQKYIKLAKELGMIDAVLIAPDDIVLDIRAYLKCRWGCSLSHAANQSNVRCGSGTTLEQRQAMIKAYKNILLIHNNDRIAMSRTVLDIERAAFYDGYYFAFGLRCCNLCVNCAVMADKDCPTPKLVRPCEESFGIDMFATVRRLGLLIEVLRKESETENRYGFVLID